MESPFPNELKRSIVKTSDGSHTLKLRDWDEQYHSRHGAITESTHVFINNGLLALEQPSSKVLEVGFGTGLNAFLTAIACKENDLRVDYTGVEGYPLTSDEWQALNYGELYNNGDHKDLFRQIHEIPWNTPVEVSAEFILEKQEKMFCEIRDKESFDLVYYDAFGPSTQPELWSREYLERMFNALKPGGSMVTYCAKGSVRRTLEDLGFQVERLPGPPGKREMLRAVKKK